MLRREWSLSKTLRVGGEKDVGQRIQNVIRLEEGGFCVKSLAT